MPLLTATSAFGLGRRAGVLLNNVIYTVSVPSSIKEESKYWRFYELPVNFVFSDCRRANFYVFVWDDSGVTANSCLHSPT